MIILNVMPRVCFFIFWFLLQKYLLGKSAKYWKQGLKDGFRAHWHGVGSADLPLCLKTASPTPVFNNIILLKSTKRKMKQDFDEMIDYGARSYARKNVWTDPTGLIAGRWLYAGKITLPCILPNRRSLIFARSFTTMMIPVHPLWKWVWRILSGSIREI